MNTENLKPTVSISALDILKGIPSSEYKRTASIDFENLATRNPLVFKGSEDEVSRIARATLETLRQDTDIYSIYARPDILRGLTAINHPATQLVIAESIVLEKEEYVVNATVSLLTKAKEIYPETIVYLLQQESAKAKALLILEQNKTAGIQDGKVIPDVKDILLGMLEQDSDIKAKKRVAMITALLHERSGDNTLHALYAKSMFFLSGEIDTTVRKLSERDNFLSFVEKIVSANHNMARSSDVTQMEIAVPQDLISEPEETAATLNRLGLKGMAEYRSLIALAKVKARESLQIKVAEEKKQEERIKLIRQQEQALIDQQKAMTGQKEEEARKLSKIQMLATETALAGKALDLFPHLKS